MKKLEYILNTKNVKNVHYDRRAFSVAGQMAWNSLARSTEQHRLFQASTRNVLDRAILVHPARYGC